MILLSRSDEVVSDANQKPETLNHKLKHVRRAAIPAHKEGAYMALHFEHKIV